MLNLSQSIILTVYIIIKPMIFIIVFFPFSLIIAIIPNIAINLFHYHCFIIVIIYFYLQLLFLFSLFLSLISLLLLLLGNQNAIHLSVFSTTFPEYWGGWSKKYFIDQRTANTVQLFAAIKRIFF